MYMHAGETLPYQQRALPIQSHWIQQTRGEGTLCNHNIIVAVNKKLFSYLYGDKTIHCVAKKRDCEMLPYQDDNCVD